MSSHKWDVISFDRCPICESKDVELACTVEDTLIPLINNSLPRGTKKLADITNNVCKCNACGVGFLSPRLNPMSLKVIYQRWYAYTYAGIFNDENHKVFRLEEFKNSHIQLLEKYCEKKGRLLDVGCGTGLFLRLAKERGYDVLGLEFDEKTSKFGAKENDVEIKHGTIDDVLDAAEEFDVITMFDYLEHSENPKLDLIRLRKLLNKSGLILIRVPNYKGLQSVVMGRHWLAIICNHLFYFNRRSLEDLLSSAGFEPISFSAKNSISQKAIISQRFNWVKKRYIETYNQDHVDGGVAIDGSVVVVSGLQKALRFIMALFVEQVDHLGGWLNMGNNLFVIAKKKDNV